MKLVPLSKGFHAAVSDEDFERVSAFKWCASIESRGTKVYGIRWKRINGRQVKIRMHHFVLGIEPGSLPEGKVVKHLNDDGLDNRRENLELGSQASNMDMVAGWKRRKIRTAEEPSL